jgi:lysozyme
MTTINKYIAGLMAISSAGLIFIATHEGTKPQAYLDPVGIPTICNGHTRGVKIGQRKTENECQQLLREDASAAGQAIAKCTTARLTQEQYDALVSFTFNVGGAAYCKSTLARKLNAGNCEGAAKEFDKWVMAKGRKLPGLVKRRAAEKAMFLKGCEL